MEPSQRRESRGQELETLRRLNLCVWLLAAWLGLGLTSLLAFRGLFFGGLWPTLVVALSVMGFLLARRLAAGLAQQKARSFTRGPSGHSRSCGYDELLMRPAPTLLRLLKELLEVENKASCGSKDLEHSFQSFLPKLVAQNGLNLRLAQQVLESKWPECQVDRFARACIYDHFYTDMARQAVQQNSQALGLVNWSEIDDRDARKPSAKLSILEAGVLSTWHACKLKQLKHSHTNTLSLALMHAYAYLCISVYRCYIYSFLPSAIPKPASPCRRPFSKMGSSWTKPGKIPTSLCQSC